MLANRIAKKANYCNCILGQASSQVTENIALSRCGKLHLELNTISRPYAMRETYKEYWRGKFKNLVSVFRTSEKEDLFPMLKAFKWFVMATHPIMHAFKKTDIEKAKLHNSINKAK